MMTSDQIGNVVKVLEDIHLALTVMNAEINKLVQETIKLQERIEDATTTRSKG